GDHALRLVSNHKSTTLRCKICFVPHEFFLQLFPREFERDELMVIMCTARRRQRFIGDGVIAGVAWQVIAPRAAILAYGAVPAEVQTKLQALPMKRASPIKGVMGAKVVPFDRDSNFIHIAVQRAPSVFHFTPGVLFGRATGIHPANYECCRGECKAGFFSSSASRSHFPSFDAASYALCAKSSSTASAFSALRTASHG